MLIFVYPYVDFFYAYVECVFSIYLYFLIPHIEKLDSKIVFPL